LSGFFRDYVYIPLGGNRYRHVRNILIVWLLTGLWHGASWNFVIWGLFYGVILLIEKTLFNRKLLEIPSPFCHIYTFVIVMLGWAIFYFTDVGALWTFLKGAFGIGCRLYDLTSVSAICTNLWLIIICAIGITPVPNVIYTHLCKEHKKFALVSEPVLVGLGMLICFILLVGQTYNPFLYFRF
jgi:alginate O-acetyltransferase complex protein AlgI